MSHPAMRDPGSASSGVVDTGHEASITSPPEGLFLAPVDLLAQLLTQSARVASALERLAPPAPQMPDFGSVLAARWRRPAGRPAYLQPVSHPATIEFGQLQHLDRQKEALMRNTAQFVGGYGANDVLLTGARGTGKSSLVKACLNHFAPQGLRLIEVDRNDLVDLPDIVDLVSGLPYHFIVFCDDLSFEAGDPGYKALKVVLDGSVAERASRVLVYATSNRRHLLPEYHRDNSATRYDEDGEIHPGESVEEKISLSERFGLWLSFHPFRQDDYLDIVSAWLRHHGCSDQEVAAAHRAALQWALGRGSRSGRVAQQFAADWAGQLGRASRT